jgi:O-antigen ligase
MVGPMELTDTRNRYPLFFCFVLLAAFLAGTISVIDPVTLSAIILALGALGACTFLAFRPQRILVFSFLLLLLAVTKFRKRDVGALLDSGIDAQIVYELILYGVVLAITLLNLSVNSRKYLSPTSLELVLFGYVALALSSTLWSDSFQYTLVRSVQLVILCTFSFAAVRILSPRKVLRILTMTLVLSVSIFAIMALIFPWADGTIISYPGVQRFSWFAVHPIMAAVLAAEAAILLVAELLFASGSWRRRMIGCPLWLWIVPLIAILGATRSRGPLIAFVIVVSMLVVRKLKVSIGLWTMGIIGYLILAVSAVLLSFGFSFTGAMRDLLDNRNMFSDFLLRDQNVETFLSVTGRVELWHDVYKLFLEQPVLGRGYAASRSILPQMLSWAAESHNSLTESLLCLGIVGTVLVWFPLMRTLLLSFSRTFRSAESAVWPQASIFGLLLFILLNSFSDATFTGFPTYDQVVFFSAIFANNALNLDLRTPENNVAMKVHIRETSSLFPRVQKINGNAILHNSEGAQSRQMDAS